MNARVFLLVLVSALFMAAWNGDQKTMQAAIARRDQLREEAWEKVLQTKASDETPVVIPVALTSSSDPVLAEPEEVRSANDDIDVPLPPGIVAGQYRAVSQTGITQEITVSPEDVAGPGVGRDFYMVDAKDGNRWYLIRIQ